MEVYRTDDGAVAKYVHDDGSETAIKTTPESLGNGTYGGVTNKYNVFISTSVGCVVGCKFCYLTTKKCPYVDLKAEEVVKNVMAAIRQEVTHRPELANMYTKLSWMGMGDVLLSSFKMYSITMDIMYNLQHSNLSLGIDGVDISTTIPRVDTYEDIDYIAVLGYDIKCFNLNPKRHYGEKGSRYPLRVFYSLHSAVEDTRRSLIPLTSDIVTAVHYLKTLSNSRVTVIVHHMFFKDINDTQEEVDALVNLYKDDYFSNVELRILRFNKCPGTTYEESTLLKSIIEVLLSNNITIKVQSSPGAEVKAACGQFLLSNII
jgi:adenine C2-methylase RlmN of 23S rRNA A2503 and tRNA A37